MMIPFGIPNTAEVIYAEDWNQPANTVKLVTPVSPVLGYVIDETGNWVPPMNFGEINDTVRKVRKMEILNKWPIDKQLEAITDFLAGDETKFKQLKESLDTIKLGLPFHDKPEDTSKPKTKTKVSNKRNK